jgi:hypothetical protein
MPEQGQQFNCPQCGEPQFTADFGFSKHYHPTEAVKDPCVFCGDSTAAGGLNRVNTKDPESVRSLIKNIPLMNPKFIDRMHGEWDAKGDGSPPVEGYACSDCMSVPCAKCGDTIPYGEDHVNNSESGFYHEKCIDPKTHSDICCTRND